MKHPKAIISLTSWEGRIETCGLTIYNLLTKCPGFHIVLTLSLEEFPRKEHDLPMQLQRMFNANLFEIIWTDKNYKSFKKWIFAAEKYATLPIISADDDCIYKANYAEILYQAWLTNKNCAVTNEPNVAYGIELPCGCETLYPPIKKLRNAMHVVLSRDELIHAGNDDFCVGFLLKMLKIPLMYTYCGFPLFHDDANGGNYVKNDKMFNLLKEVFCYE